MNMSVLGVRLKSARERAKLSQVALSQAVGISQSYVAQVENGNRLPSLDVLLHLAQVLNTSIAWLCGEHCSDQNTLVAHSRTAILHDLQVAPGLREFADDETLCAALDITSDEWMTLRSIVMKSTPGKNGYLLLLHTLRTL